MTKDIYIIKNDINDKVYIGQAKNAQQRFNGHCKNKNPKKKMYIDQEIQRLGKEHFWYEILESQIENYNEQEIYWIAFFNSKFPNGYNRSNGGELSFINPSGVNSPYSIIKDEKILQTIYQDLISKQLTLDEISHKYDVSVATISNINQGITYHNDTLAYPLRPTTKGNTYYLTETEKNRIKNEIKNERIIFKAIAKKYNMPLNTIYHINNGTMWYDESNIYPLRQFHYSEKNKLNMDQVQKIHEDLINTNLSLRAIAKNNNTSLGTVQAIKNGERKSYILNGYSYPLRPNNFKKPVSTISVKESTATIDT